MMQFPGAAEKAEDKLQEERLKIQEKAEGVCRQLQAKGSYIKSIKWSCDGVRRWAIGEVLLAAAGNVESLDVSAQLYMSSLPNVYASFGDILVDGLERLSFKSLTNLIIGDNALASVDTIPYLLNVCPQLSTLDINVGRFPVHEQLNISAYSYVPPPKLVIVSTTLRRLRIVISEGILHTGVPEPPIRSGGQSSRDRALFASAQS
jgi:hypothetical protein